MKPIAFLALLALLTACVTTADDTPPSVAAAKIVCADGETEWREYLAAVTRAGATAAKPHLDCAAAGGQVDAITVLGSDLTEKPSNPDDFERGISFLRAAAIAGVGKAQRLLAFRYEAGKIETGRNWIGRNAYLALFWEGVARRKDAFYRAAPGRLIFLDRFRDQLSEPSQQKLAQEITSWQPGQPEPQNFTFDILMTGMVAAPAGSWSGTSQGDAKKVLDFGLAANLPDADLLALFRGYSGNVDQVPEGLLDGLVARGSFLALTLKLRNVSAQKGREGEEADLIGRLLTRLGLDLRYLQPEHDDLLAQFSESGDVDQLMRAVAAASRPERQILATIAAMNACNDAYPTRCDQTLAVLQPLITPIALNFVIFVRAMDECAGPSRKLACLLDNGGMTALRDIIVNDTVDLGGRSV